MIKPTFYAGWPLLLCSQEVVLAPPRASCAARLVWCGGRCLPPGTAKQGMVASVDATATQVGVDISRRAGMPLMPPWRWATRWRYASAGRESGRWWFYADPLEKGNTTAIDFREMAPAKATRDISSMIRATRTAKNHSLRIWLRHTGYGSRFLAGAG